MFARFCQVCVDVRDPVPPPVSAAMTFMVASRTACVGAGVAHRPEEVVPSASAATSIADAAADSVAGCACPMLLLAGSAVAVV